MDPLTALGVASNAIQIVDFGVRFFTQVKECGKSADGSIEELNGLKVDAKRFQTVNTSLIEALKQKNERDPLEDEILVLCSECHTVAAELANQLDGISKGQKAGPVQALRVVMKATWRQKGISKLQRRLRGLRDMLSTTILANMQRDLLLNTQEAAATTEVPWAETQTLGEWMESQRNDMAKLQDNLLSAVASSHWQSIKSINEKRQYELRSWGESSVVKSLKDSLLDKLVYREISVREDRIPEAFQKTFEWVFSSSPASGYNHVSWSSLRDWLRHGNDIYWITGKAGSGKSTLMKMLSQDRRTSALLESWSGSTPIITANHYFWNSGTSLQMSQEGLLRSLLHQALTKLFAMPSRSSASKWSAFSLSLGRTLRGYDSHAALEGLSWDQLVQGFRFLVEGDDEFPINYAFFIDGLDEYCGDLSKLISLVRQIASYPNVKVCVSSRPWPEFEDAFKKQPNLMMQYRTLADIAWYAEQNLSTNLAFCQLRQYDPAYAQMLIESITTKASGVFLWVVLVVQSLLEGLIQGDKPTELQNRLAEIPDELEELFKKILHGLQGDRFRDAAHLFRIFRAAPEKPSVLTLSLADDDDDDIDSSGLGRDQKLLSPNEIWYRSITMKRRLASRCRGLLEIGAYHRNSSINSIWLGVINKEWRELPDDSETSKSETDNAASITDFPSEEGHALATATIDYLHRTVKDFLESPKIWTHIEASSKDTFHPNASLFRAYLVLMKTLPPACLIPSVIHSHIWRCIDQAQQLAYDDCELHVKYLDAMDEVVICTTNQEDPKGRTYIQQYWGPGVAHWASTLSQGKLTDRFYVLAVRCNLIEYLDFKFKQSPPTPEQASQLLETAVTRYNVPGFPGPTRSKPVQRTIDFLLKRGADPRILATKVAYSVDDSDSVCAVYHRVSSAQRKERARCRAERLQDWMWMEAQERLLL